MEHNFFSKKNLQLLSIFLVILSIFFLFKILQTIKDYKNPVTMGNQISISGTGEAYASPDVAEITFSIEKEDKTVKVASEYVNQKTKEVLDFLKTKKVEEKDIKTVNDSFYPEYDYPQTVCSYYPCPVSTPVIRGYRVSRSFSVKIRNVDDVSSVSEGLGLLALSNMSGPNFVVDNDESVKSEARTMAIKNAKEKAKQISKDLDIKLKRIVSFYEEEPSGGFMPYMSKAMDVSVASGEEFSSGTPILPTGENKYTSKITVVYEVR